MSKGRVNVHVRPDASTLACTTDPDGLAVLVNRLSSPQLQLIAMEASCGYTESCWDQSPQALHVWLLRQSHHPSLHRHQAAHCIVELIRGEVAKYR